MRRSSALAAVAALLAAGVATAGPGAATAAAPAPAMTRVIVQGSSVGAAAQAVRDAGGQVIRPLGIVSGVAAELPAGRVPSGVIVTPDASVTPAGHDTSEDPSVKSVYRYEVGAESLPAPTKTAPSVAVIDTGISPVMGLADNLRPVPDPVREGQLAPCANFSSEPTCDDSYGHGTFMAGLIAGDKGMAPSAGLVAVKIAGRSGSADVSQLLAAIQYVVSFKDQLNIKVLNLSLGSNSTHDYRYDPLNRAVERAWQAGITVVVAASNRGPSARTISKPADDPLVITVGAVDDRETPATSDDTVPAFTGRGPVVFGSTTFAKPDVVAPGVGLLSLNVAGSYIDKTAGPSTYPVPGYRRGSGSSQAAAVVSGAVALMHERADLRPDEIKRALALTASKITGDVAAVGAGVINVAQALRAPVIGYRQPAVQALGTDGLDVTRAQLLVTSAGCGVFGEYYRAFIDPKCDYVHGDMTAQGRAFAEDEFNEEWTGQSWYASQWVTGQSWYGQSWYGQSWYGQSWYGYGGSTPPTEGQVTPLGTVLKGSAFYGVWR
jgi:serine protease AprX